MTNSNVCWAGKKYDSEDTERRHRSNLASRIARVAAHNDRFSHGLESFTEALNEFSDLVLMTLAEEVHRIAIASLMLQLMVTGSGRYEQFQSRNNWQPLYKVIFSWVVYDWLLGKQNTSKAPSRVLL